ncbi:MAG: helix-turn-helix domain-containing protein [Thermomicrobiales bacterium]|nr:helix-turn-helix domain-containing protein [Thermomicrobiales bacterium]MCO5218640.1 helix-turn-helix domain-containing protein [Thermomicrobiales bacterium]MCO5224317.1 helix-turn-helix domain-containing protein [Thermomicrobiales bacterium]MCO5229056.1 helix-turn-helix domain-containing protein [Thermomicrobiales bacterium]
MTTEFFLETPEIPWTETEWERASRYTYTVWWSAEDEHYLARCEEIPEAISHGTVPSEAIENATDAVASYLDVFDDAPPPTGEEPVAGAHWTTADVAEQLGVTVRRVQSLARSRGVGIRRGKTLLFTNADIAAMKERKVGRPRKSVAI